VGLRDRVSEGKGDLGEIKKKQEFWIFDLLFVCIYNILYTRTIYFFS
jgi:hypothetical protein